MNCLTENIMRCLNCDKITNNPKFCSRSCAVSVNNSGKYRNGKPSRLCLVCGKKTNESTKKFCSRECYYEHRQIEKIRRIVETGTLEHLKSPSTKKATLLQMRTHCCEICLNSKWQRLPIPLVMDHISGNPDDHRLNNLRLICGNCDMQLPTFAGRNRGNGRAYRRQRYKEGKSS